MRFSVRTETTEPGRSVVLTDTETGLDAAICPEAGAELAAFGCRTDDGRIELLHRALDYRPADGWQGRGPWLWPAVGRTFSEAEISKIIQSGADVRIGTYSLPPFPGRTFQMPCHGFAMRRPWTLEQTGTNDSASCRCSLSSDARTRELYPFDFKIELLTRLRGDTLRFQFDVCAAESNPAPMPMSAGNHFSFALPFTGGTWDDVTFETPAGQRFLLNAASLLSAETEDLGEGVCAPATDPALHDTVLGGYRREPAWAELRQTGGPKVRVVQTQSSETHARLEDCYFVLYAQPEHGVFCAEPWVGAPNALNTGAPVQLVPGDRWSWEVLLQVSTR